MGHDSHAKLREYKSGDSVMAKNYGSGPKWESAVVMERKGPLSYTVQLNSGVIWRRHIDQLRDGAPVTSQDEEVTLRRHTGDLESQGPEQTSNNLSETAEPEPDNASDPPARAPVSENTGASSTGQPAPQVEPEPKRYPSRVRQPPPRYM